MFCPRLRAIVRRVTASATMRAPRQSARLCERRAAGTTRDATRRGVGVMSAVAVAVDATGASARAQLRARARRACPGALVDIRRALVAASSRLIADWRRPPRAAAAAVSDVVVPTQRAQLTARNVSAARRGVRVAARRVACTRGNQSTSGGERARARTRALVITPMTTRTATMRAATARAATTRAATRRRLARSRRDGVNQRRQHASARRDAPPSRDVAGRRLV